MSMNMREIASAALDEWEREQKVESEVQDIDFTATASKMARAGKGIVKDMRSGAGKMGMGNGGVAGAMMDLQKHDAARHGGHFDPSKQTCKFREDMAKTLNSMGMLNGQNPQMEAQLKEKLGEKNVKSGAQAAGKADKDGTVDPELVEIRNMVKEKGKEKDPTKKAEIEKRLQMRRDAYYKRNMRDAEYNAMKEMHNVAMKDPSKAKAVIEKAAEIEARTDIEDVAKDAASDLKDKALSAMEEAYRNGAISEKDLEDARIEHDRKVEPPQENQEQQEQQQASEGLPHEEEVPQKTVQEQSQPQEETPPPSEEQQKEEENPSDDGDDGEESPQADTTEQPESESEETPPADVQEPEEEQPEQSSVMSEIEKQLNGLFDIKQWAGESDEQFGDRVNGEINRVMRLIADANLSSEEFAKAASNLNAMAHDVQNRIRQQQEQKEQQRKEKEEAELKQYEDMVAEANSPENRKRDELEARNDEIRKINADTGMSPTEKRNAIRKADAKYRKAVEKIDAEEMAKSTSATQEAPSDIRQNEDGTMEYDVNGKTYIDVTNVDPAKQMDVIMARSSEGKEFLKRAAQNEARWNEITSQIPGFQDKINALKSVASQQMRSAEFAIARSLTDDPMAEAAIDALSNEFANAKSYTERQKVRDKLAKVCADYGIGNSNATQTSNAKRQKEQSAAEGQEIKNRQTENAIRLANDKAENDRLHKESQRQLQQAKFEYQKAKDGNKQMEKTAAELNPDLVTHITDAMQKMTGKNQVKADALSQILSNLQSNASKDPSKAIQWLEKANLIINGRPNSAKEKGFDYDAYEPVVSTKKNYAQVDRAALDQSLDSVMAKDDNSKSKMTQQEKDDQKNRLDGLFRNVGLNNVSVKDVVDGPSVSNLVLDVPNDGTVKKEMIDRLKDNIETAFGLSEDKPAKIVRMDGNIVVQLPKKNRDTVTFGDLYRSPEFAEAKKKMHMPIIIGRDSMGRPMIKDLSDLRHLLIAGETGGGKSVGLNSVLTSLLAAKEAGELDMDLVDLKAGIELGRFGKMPHLRGAVATDSDTAAQRIADFKRRMDATMQKLAAANCRDIWEYNEKHPNDKIKPNVLAIDELAELIEKDKSIVEPLMSITALGRAAGFALIAATQRPDAKLIPGRLKANIPGTMAFKTKNGVNSSIILGEGETAAKDLLGNGDMIFSDGQKLTRAQGAFISNDEQSKINDVIAKAHNAIPQTPTQPTNNAHTSATTGTSNATQSTEHVAPKPSVRIPSGLRLRRPLPPLQPSAPQQPSQPHVGSTSSTQTAQPHAEEVKSAQETEVKLPDNLPNTTTMNRIVQSFNSANGPMKKNILAMINRELAHSGSQHAQQQTGANSNSAPTTTQVNQAQPQNNWYARYQGNSGYAGVEKDYPVGTVVERDDGTRYIREEGYVTDGTGENPEPRWREVKGPNGSTRAAQQGLVFHSQHGIPSKVITEAQNP